MINRLLFEDLLLLALLLGIAEFVLLWHWARRRDRASSRALLVGLSASTALIFLSALVHTPREQVVDVCHHLATLVDEGDVAKIGDVLHDEFQAGSLGRAAFLSRVESALTRYRVDQPRLRGFEVTVTGGDQAIANFQASAQIRSAEQVYGRLPSRWGVAFRRTGSTWKVTSVESIPVPPLNLRNLDEWLR